MVYRQTREQKEKVSDIIDDIGVFLYDLENDEESSPQKDKAELIDELSAYQNYLRSKSKKKFAIIHFNKKLDALID